jgi:hypothetical protein
MEENSFNSGTESTGHGHACIDHWLLARSHHATANQDTRSNQRPTSHTLITRPSNRPRWPRDANAPDRDRDRNTATTTHCVMILLRNWWHVTIFSIGGGGGEKEREKKDVSARSQVAGWLAGRSTIWSRTPGSAASQPAWKDSTVGLAWRGCGGVDSKCGRGVGFWISKADVGTLWMLRTSFHRPGKNVH